MLSECLPTYHLYQNVANMLKAFEVCWWSRGHNELIYQCLDNVSVSVTGYVESTVTVQRD